MEVWRLPLRKRGLARLPRRSEVWRFPLRRTCEFTDMTKFHLHPNRRQMLQRAGAGFGSLALAALLADESHAAVPANPLAPREPHFKPRAKRVIFLFMPGGPSQVDTFDPKPELTKQNGKPSPKLYLGKQRNLLASPWTFKKYGKSGLEVS